MPHLQLEETLRNLSTIGRELRRAPGVSIWRFEHENKGYLLHFYPRPNRFARIFRGNPALRELRLSQRLQKADVPLPRAISALVGFRLGGQTGDALLVQSLEPATPIDPMRRGHQQQVIDILHQLARAGLGDKRLGLDRFIVVHDKVFLRDASSLRPGGLRMSHLLRLAHEARPRVTSADLVRGWRELGPPGRAMPKHNPLSPRLWRRQSRQVLREGRNFGRLRIGEWSGVFTRRAARPQPWSQASHHEFSASDWSQAWPKLLADVRDDRVAVIKRDQSGDVLAGAVTLGVRSIEVVIKRPRRKAWWRHWSELVWHSRGQRTWIRTWKMLIRGVPTEWPMLLMERRRFGLAIESILVFERVPGATLATIDLDSMKPLDRQNLFRRAGAVLRRIDALGFMHADAKSTNWIVFDDPARGASPVLLDLDGVRHYRWQMMGIERLLRAMRQHPQYTPEDSFHLCQGFAPGAKLAREADNAPAPPPPAARD